MNVCKGPLSAMCGEMCSILSRRPRPSPLERWRGRRSSHCVGRSTDGWSCELWRRLAAAPWAAPMQATSKKTNDYQGANQKNSIYRNKQDNIYIYTYKRTQYESKISQALWQVPCDLWIQPVPTRNLQDFCCSCQAITAFAHTDVQHQLFHPDLAHRIPSSSQDDHAGSCHLWAMGTSIAKTISHIWEKLDLRFIS